MDSVLGIGGLLTGALGIILTTYYARKAERLNKMRKRLEWPDLQAAANDLGERIKRDTQPDVVVTPGLTGATFANLLVGEFSHQPPVFVGTRTWKDDPHQKIPQGASILLETKKWLVTIPRDVLSFKDQHILIVDDFVMSGDFLDSLRAELERAGFLPQNIRAASIAVTRVAIKNHKAPEYYWWIADDDDFFFPWGKAK